MNDDQLIREIAEIKAIQSVTMHLIASYLDSLSEAFGRGPGVALSKSKELVPEVRDLYEDRLRDELGLPRFERSSDSSSPKTAFEWPDVLDSSDSE